MIDKLRNEFLNPDKEYTPIPFWFWNDNLNEKEIKRQINDFNDKGVNAFVIHPRIGIPVEIQYLSDRFMELVKCAVMEAERLGMKVVLYDEAMYPSGSAHGMVVKNNPEYASKGLMMKEYACSSAEEVIIEEMDGEKFVTALAVKKLSDSEIEPSYTVKLEVNGNKINFQPKDNENWSILLFFQVYTKGHIRGIHFGEDDNEPFSPASSDLLNPQAISKFIEYTHERYYEVLKEYFGSTIIAMFTDEPDIMGRGAKRGLKPWTNDFLTFYVEQGNSELDLPLLWFDAEGISAAKRRKYGEAINKRLAQAYYEPISIWCKKHNIALTGHPHESDDIGFLKYFHIPSQDIVWRWVAPEDGLALEGEHSTMGKCSSDSARHRGRRRNGNECFACCGSNKIEWSFTAADMKWYMDWLFVRGVNVLFPHAFFYSINGERRVGERPPDVGPNNIWWPYYNKISDYIKRMSWLMTDSVNVTQIAVLCEANHLPWKIVKPLYENQIEFNYLEKELFISDNCSIHKDKLKIQKQEYKVLLIEDADMIDSEVMKKADAFIKMGGKIVLFREKEHSIGLESVIQIKSMEEAATVVQSLVNRDIEFSGNNRGLRVSHVVKSGVHFFLFVNEGEEKINSKIQINTVGDIEIWDPWQGTITKGNAESISKHSVGLAIELDRRESKIICINETCIPETESCKVNYRTIKEIKIDKNWFIHTTNGKIEERDILKPWNTWIGMENFCGKVTYEVQFNINDLEKADKIELDLGEVCEIVIGELNGRELDVRLWHPYVYDISHIVKEGNNKLKLEVTNTLANKISNAGIKSGLIGPVAVKLITSK